MGTNYYWHERPACESCGRDYEPLHIGKSSAGWCFALHVIPEKRISTLDDWKARWNKPETHIKNEYGEEITASEMVVIISDRRNPSKGGVPVPPGYASWRDFYDRNGAEEGPDGLVRHRVDGLHCPGHGPGTWDYITGEFS